MMSTTNDSVVRRSPLVAVGGAAVLALILGLLFGVIVALPMALLGVVAALILLRKTPAWALLGAGANVVVVVVLYVIAIFTAK
ncbi:hypothetical protein AB0P21_16880 [Kribbella sp. NPDC056861]|uniref:hypothetical protein n=1 Tax=Kribbella sp. NPDC056861 TaxID=3154857 RepID=UPI0034372437